MIGVALAAFEQHLHLLGRRAPPLRGCEMRRAIVLHNLALGDIAALASGFALAVVGDVHARECLPTLDVGEHVLDSDDVFAGHGAKMRGKWRGGKDRSGLAGNVELIQTINLANLHICYHDHQVPLLSFLMLTRMYLVQNPPL